MTWAAVLLFVLGVGLSAVCSGCETGFYRVNRARLVLDGLEGDRISRALLWLANHPSVFIATALAGTNLAHDLVSFAVVLLTRTVMGEGAGHGIELLITAVSTPIVFVYGELLPKGLFLQAPNRLLRGFGLFFLGMAVVCAPISALLWGLSRILEKWTGEPTRRTRQMFARRELEEMLQQGHEAGILRATELDLARGLFAAASQPVNAVMHPAYRMPRVRSSVSTSDAIRLARRYQAATLAVENERREPVGYVRVVDMRLANEGKGLPVRPFVDLPSGLNVVAALIAIHTSGEYMARVVDARNEAVGFVALSDLHGRVMEGED
jgi:CBS domain containing-hemolysin-like protein